ncbi:DinB family protein [Ichthyenterobacterium magnum]|uniref:DinB family protein n=1 Tax=Ichthyenterobacterium magnum TaxID=1230530 RepID=A0A420DGT9_9FLAO|nr:DinB family protein [Ichthyenterobacterium magnum]RKE92296.1 DinB family protein [Ichthyenterobacterium magnum]
MTSKDLIQDLLEATRKNINQVEAYNQLSLEILNWKSTPESWSVLECIEHLNRYSDFYIPEIEKQIDASKHKASEVFKSGWLGNYFAKNMLPKEKLNTMKTFKSMNPLGSNLSKGVLTKFIDQQHKLLNLLDKSKKVNLTKTKTAISISKLIKLRLGDTFRVVIYHNQRHIVQAEKNILKAKL